MRAVHWFAASLPILCLLTGCGKPEPITAGQAAPKLSAVNLRGEPLRLDSVLGEQATLLLFASGSCCRDQAVLANRLYRDLGNQGLGVLVLTGDPRDDVLALVEEESLTCPIGLDPVFFTVKRYGVSVYPTAFILDASGTIRKRLVGTIPEETLFEELARLLKRR